jgi:hypothetical protein
MRSTSPSGLSGLPSRKSKDLWGFRLGTKGRGGSRTIRRVSARLTEPMTQDPLPQIVFQYPRAGQVQCKPDFIIERSFSPGSARISPFRKPIQDSTGPRGDSWMPRQNLTYLSRTWGFSSSANSTGRAPFDQLDDVYQVPEVPQFGTPGGRPRLSGQPPGRLRLINGSRASHRRGRRCWRRSSARRWPSPRRSRSCGSTGP